jgi:photosystem II stability/assembly factor-like uncharacterized protein
MKKIFTSELLPKLHLPLCRIGRLLKSIFVTHRIIVLIFAFTALISAQSSNNKNSNVYDYNYNWECIGPPGGRVYELAINPQKTEIVFGSAEGGLFKTTDGGITSELDTTFPFSSVPALSPLNPDLMFYSFYRTTNGGISWDSMETAAWSYAFHPYDENFIYAINGYINNNPGKNLIVSYDKGAHWDTLASFQDQIIGSIKTSNFLSDVIYISKGSNQLLKSYDSGITWDTILTIPNSGISFFEICGLAQDYIYVLTNNNNFYRSSDGGISWVLKTSPPTFLVNIMVVNQRDSNTIFLASGDYLYGYVGDILKSTDGGSSWMKMYNGLPTPYNRYLYSLIINPANPDILYVGTYGWGVYKTKNGAESWTQTNLTKTPVFSIHIDEHNPEIIYACTIDEGVLKTTNVGLGWQLLNLNVPQTVQMPFFKIIFDPNNSDIAYITSQYGLHKSTDGGLSWYLTSLLGSFDHFVYEVSVHPNSSDTVYAGTMGYLGPKDLFRSVDGGNNWTNLNLTGSEEGVAKVLFDPTSPDVIYVGALSKGIYKSTDRGLTWFTINNGLQISDPPLIKSIYSIDLNETNPNILYSDNGGVVKTTNGGQEWFRIDSMLFEIDENIQVRKVAKISNKVYASSSSGLFVTSNDGLSWQQIGTFPIMSLSGEIKEDPINSSEIYISTTAGLYKGIDTVTSVEKIEDLPMLPILLQNYPNPFNSNTKISFNLDKRRFITIKIYNILGKEVASVLKQTLDTGTHIVGWDGTNYSGENLPSGIYFYRLEAEDYTEVKKLIILR